MLLLVFMDVFVVRAPSLSCSLTFHRMIYSSLLIDLVLQFSCIS